MAEPNGDGDFIHGLRLGRLPKDGQEHEWRDRVHRQARDQKLFSAATVIALSSAEAELYAMVAASAEALAIVAYAKDVGIDMTGEVYFDSIAALGISHRCGIGKVRHLRTQGLWSQEAWHTGNF